LFRNDFGARSRPEAPKGSTSAFPFARRHGLNTGDLARILKVDRTLAGKILRAERRLTVDHIRVLAKHFDCDPERFVDPA